MTIERIAAGEVSKYSRQTIFGLRDDAGNDLTLAGAIKVTGTFVANFTGDEADLDSGAGTDNHEVVAIGLPGAGGHVVAGTVTNPFNVNVGNFPAVQPVNDNGASLTVDGTVTANAGTGIFGVNITDAFFSATEGGALPTEFVVVAGDDGTDTHPLQLNAAGDLKTSLDGEVVSIQDGGNVISVDDAAGSLTVDGTVSISGTVTVDSELPAAAALADATANPTVPGIGGFLMGYNGTTWDRVRVANTGRLQVDVVTGGGGGGTEFDDGDAIDTDSQGTLILGSTSVPGTARVLNLDNSGRAVIVGPVTPSDALGNTSDHVRVFAGLSAFNGTTWGRVRTVNVLADAETLSNQFGVGNWVFNGTSWDRIRTTPATEASSTTGIQAVGVHGVDPVSNVLRTIRVRGTDGDGFAGIHSLQTLGFTYGFNQTSGFWDRIRTALPAVGSTTLTDGVLAIAGYAHDGTAFRRMTVDTSGFLRTTGAGGPPSDTFSNTSINHYNNLSASMLYDAGGANWNRWRSDAVDGFGATGCGNIRIHETRNDGISTATDRVRHSATRSFTGVAANGAGTAVDMTNTPMSKFTMIVNRTAGATNIVDIRLEASIDGTIFVQIAQITDLTNTPVLITAVNVPARYMRYNVITVGAGNTHTIQLLAVR